ncbi:MAG: hypothetical protein JXB36_05095 [Gammaproteobacteria bacterium]|nr:hypothetical protein [Gammaproteobacteria bacterium]
MAGEEIDPVVGNWYRHLDKGQMFRVVGIDERRGLIEIQHFDGDLEEIEQADWGDMELEAIAAPEDWTGPIDDVEDDDLGYSETDMTSADWRRSVQENPSDPTEAWEDVQPQDEPDDWDEGGATEVLYDARMPDDLQSGSAPEDEAEDGDEAEDQEPER